MNWRSYFLGLLCVSKLAAAQSPSPDQTTLNLATSAVGIADVSASASASSLPAPASVPAPAPMPASMTASMTVTGALNLPSLPEPATTSTGVIPAGNSGLQLRGVLDGDRYLIKQDFTNPKGAELDVNLATGKIADTTIGWLMSAQPSKAETVMNLGWRPGIDQQLIVTAAQLRAAVDVDTGLHNTLAANQNAGGLDYRYVLGSRWLSGLDVSGYASKSQSLAAQNSQDHVAGAAVTGLRVDLESAPLTGSKLKIGIGTEHVAYDSLTSSEPIQNFNATVKWSQVLWPSVKYSASLVDSGTQRNISTGVEFRLPGGQQLGLSLARTQSADGQLTDHTIQLSYTLQFGKKFAPFQLKGPQALSSTGFVPEVLQRPAFLPSAVLSRPDSRLN